MTTPATRPHPAAPARVDGELHPQLAAVVAEFESARAALHRLAAELPAARWALRSDPARWSVAECVAHLNITSRAYLPVLRDGLDRARTLGVPAPARYRRDPVGWLLWRTVGPVKHVGRMNTPAAFVPSGDLPRDAVLAEFDRLQDEQVALARSAHGLPLGAVRVPSPFDPRVRYNLFSCFTILPRHQHRHVVQAERVWHGRGIPS